MYKVAMITEADKQIICKISKRYHVKRVLLFGSSVDEMRESNDIDIAVEGISPKDYYRFYGELIFSLSKPVDLVDISGNSKFVKLILQEGISLYG